MCGIWAYVLRNGMLFDPTSYVRHDPWKHAASNRGPDRSTEIQGADYHFVFHRLAIHDLSPDGDQPFHCEWKDGTTVHLMCNGEIYNHQELVEKYKLQENMNSTSDCEVILHLLELWSHDVSRLVRELRGEYAFVARMEKPDGHVTLVAARDALGVRPLYYTQTRKGIAFCSMIADLVGLGEEAPEHKVYHFPPGVAYVEHVTHSAKKPSTCWWSEPVFPSCFLSHYPSEATRSLYKEITDALIESVRVRLTGQRSMGFLLSGGLDSSLVVAIATKILGVKSPRTFCIGFDPEAADFAWARKVADHLQAKHTEIIVEPQDALQSIDDVLCAVETYDITTVRASVPQWWLARYIAENTDIRVLLNGDGSDEVACGYLYNYYAPSADEAHLDAVRLLKEIHCFDGLRVDRTLGAHGMEARLPFLDPCFVKAYLSAHPSLRVPGKERMEKQLLRDAFATLYPDLLPNEVLYRVKNAFSDAVSPAHTGEGSWYRQVKAHIQKTYGMEESEWYKERFEARFPHQAHILPHLWLPPKAWKEVSDPSARLLDVYAAT